MSAKKIEKADVPEDLGDPRLPNFFPLKLSACSDKANKLFSCLEIASTPNGVSFTLDGSFPFRFYS